MHLSFPYHIVSPSPWPLYVSISLLSLLINLVSSIHTTLPLLVSIVLIYSWFRDISQESSLLGKFTSIVKLNALIWFLLLLSPQR